MTGAVEASPSQTPFDGIHASLSGLAADDHLQYALLAGRALGQTLHGGTAAGELLTLQGSSHANRGRNVLAGGATVDWDFTSDAIGGGGLLFNNVIPASGGVVTAQISIANQVTINNGLYIMSALDDLTTNFQTVAPGFAVTTLFFARQNYRSSTFGVAPAQAFNYAAQCQYWLTGAGSVNVTNYRALSFAPIIRVDNAGDQLHLANTNGVTVGPLFNTRNATAVADFGAIRGVHMINAGPILFGLSLGSEIATDWIGVDCEALTGLVVSGRKAAVRSAIPNAATNRFLENLSNANSDFGSGNAFWRDGVGVAFGGAYNAADVLLTWQAAGYFQWLFTSFSDSLRWSGPAANRFLLTSNDNTANEMEFDFTKFAFGQAGAVGNQVGIFVAQTRTVPVGGGWADFLLTQAGSLSIGALVMSDVSAWVINSISLAAGTGSIADLDTLVIGGMTTSNPGITVTRRSAFRITGRQRHSGVINNPPLRPAALTASVNDYNPATGNSMRQIWAVTSDDLGVYNITGIVPQQDNDTQKIINIGTVDNIQLTHQDAGSASANQFDLPGGATLVLAPDDSVGLWYDDVAARWKVVN